MSFNVQSCGRDKTALKADLAAKLTAGVSASDTALATAVATSLGAIIDAQPLPSGAALRVEANGHFGTGDGSMALQLRVLPASHFADWPVAASAGAASTAASAAQAGAAAGAAPGAAGAIAGGEGG